MGAIIGVVCVVRLSCSFIRGGEFMLYTALLLLILVVACAFCYFL